MQASDAVLGICASVVTEILKFVPQIRQSAVLTGLTTVIVVAVGVFIANGQFSWTSFFNALVFSFASYKVAVQPVAGAMGLKSQN